MRRLKKPIVNTNICDPGISISRQRLTNAQTPLKSTAIIFTLFFIFTNPSMAAQTTLIFEMPEVPKAPSEEYPSEQLFETYTKRAPGPKGSSLKVDALRSQNLENAWSKSFRERDMEHQNSINNIASSGDNSDGDIGGPHWDGTEIYLLGKADSVQQRIECVTLIPADTEIGRAHV